MSVESQIKYSNQKKNNKKKPVELLKIWTQWVRPIKIRKKKEKREQIWQETIN